MILLTKIPVPVPSKVFGFAIVGFGDVLQHVPRAVTVTPPSELIVPPLTADVNVIETTVAVVSTGKVAVAEVVKLISLP